MNMLPKLKFSKEHCRKFVEMFNLNLNDYTDALLSLQTQKAEFALYRFDFYMEKRLGYDVEKTGMSLRKFIKKRYGSESVALLKELMYADD